MPDRIIREKAIRSRSLLKVSGDAERLFWRLIVSADDYGRFDAEPVVVLGTALPLLIGTVSVEQVAGWLRELESVDLIHLYRSPDGNELGHFPAWFLYQRRRESRPKHPDPPCAENSSTAASCRHSRRVAASRRKLPPTRARATAESRETRAERREAGDVPPAAANGPSPPSGNGPENPQSERLRPEDIAEAWNEHCVPLGLARVREVAGSRRDRVLARLREHPEQQFWEEVLGAIRGQGFLLGKNQRGWRIDFDFLFANDVNAVRVAEGKYGGS